MNPGGSRIDGCMWDAIYGCDGCTAAPTGERAELENGHDIFLSPEPGRGGHRPLPGTLYLAGPMTGIADFNRPAFAAAAAKLRAAGWDVVSPAEFGYDPAFSWFDHMRRDIVALMACKGVALLPGWIDSEGAQLQVDIAMALGMRIEPVERWLAQ